jgi:dephospho-CoA kinase
MIIGISGTFSSGKDTLAAHLSKKYGFLIVNTGDIVREAAMQQYGSIERPVLHEVATSLRKQYGGGVLVERALRIGAMSENATGVVVTGIRSMGEAKRIIQENGYMIFIDAPIEIRYERMKGRKRDNETLISLEEFTQRENKERASGDTDADFNIDKIKEISQIKLINLKDQDALFDEADRKIIELTS